VGGSRAGAVGKGAILTLRPENTAGVVRAYIEHKLGESGQLQKLYYIGPQFRRERPQKGRYRQFWQIGAEVIGPPSSGSESPLRDAEVLRNAGHTARRVGHHGLDAGAELRGVGCGPGALQRRAASGARSEVAPKMCVGLPAPRRHQSAACAGLQSSRGSAHHRNAAEDCRFARIEESKDHFAAVTCTALEAAGVPYKLNPRLVRGLDYYTRTTFEFTHGGLGRAECAAGRRALRRAERGDRRTEGAGHRICDGPGPAGADPCRPQAASADARPRVCPTAGGGGCVYCAAWRESLNAAALVLARELRRAGLQRSSWATAVSA
jgi:histidyl-tRNA synthetase